VRLLLEYDDCAVLLSAVPLRMFWRCSPCVVTERLPLSSTSVAEVDEVGTVGCLAMNPGRFCMLLLVAATST
jgi:hypothetical protein